MLARLRGMVQALQAPAPGGEELLPTWDTASHPANGANAPLSPTDPAFGAAEIPPAAGSLSSELAPPVEIAQTPPVAESPPEPANNAASLPGEQVELVTAMPPQHCPYCQAPRTGQEQYCADCGWIFPPATASAPPARGTQQRVHARYELKAQISDREQVVRYHGLDYGAGDGPAVPVIVVRAPSPASGQELPAGELAPAEPAEAEPAAESPAPLPHAEAVSLEPAWPSIAWERVLLEKFQHPALPRVLEVFEEDGFEYLVEEVPAGQSLWDAWDDPAATAEQRFAWLKQIAGVLYHFYEHHALLEALRPDILVLTPDGQPRFTDLSDLLPLPVPATAPVRATYYTAPEVVLANDRIDSRAAIYSFGAMLYALYLGRELTELDFELQGVPKPFLERFPDASPLFGRLVSKTFCRNLHDRFPTEEWAREDATGFSELVRCLEDCRQNLDRVRLEIASWTTTGMVRSGNEDAFALLHVAEARENRLGEAALVLLADGMGGYEAGEVAAALAIRALRSNLVQQKPLAAFAGDAVLAADSTDPSQPSSSPGDVETYKTLLAAALKEANRQVYSAAQAGESREGMGCTAEVVYVDGRHVVVGHVGDSRTYHLHQGRLVQLTQDQTWVHRMVELGAMTAEEAEVHPRRSELQQAIGGRSDVEPAVYHSLLKPGDWVVVCSDGLSNQMTAEILKEMLQSAPSAEWAARRLINSVNLAGATDNATVVVIRAT